MDMDDFEIHQPQLPVAKKFISTLNRADITLFTSLESKWRATHVQRQNQLNKAVFHAVRIKAQWAKGMYLVS